LTAPKRSGIYAGLVVSVVLGFPGLIPGQDERGTVKPESMPVYSEMSVDSDIVTTLTRGKVVRITLSVTNGDGVWCSISDTDTAQKLGYVRCNELDRQNVPSTAVAGAGGLSYGSFDPASANATPSRAQEHWAIAASAILSTFNRESLNTLSPGTSAQGIRHLLQNAWGISNRDELLRMLDWIDQGGHRRMFSEIGARTAKVAPEALAKAVSRLSPEDANSVMVAPRYYARYSTQSITGWDYGRYINVCRWGIGAGYISEEEARPRVMHAAQILQQTFTSWREFGEDYLVGREYWSLHQTRIDGPAMRAVEERLLNDPGSPWNRIPWDLSLQPSASTKPGAVSVPPGR
jgi:hypothetical protein